MKYLQLTIDRRHELQRQLIENKDANMERYIDSQLNFDDMMRLDASLYGALLNNYFNTYLVLQNKRFL